MKEINLNNELRRLHTHLENNQRTILTAKFGNGKTTLLRQFMKKYEHEYEFVVLHPVNYSVGSNEDVFEYIKRDILVQLAEKDLLNAINLDDVQAALFTWENISELVSFLLSMSPAGERAAKLWDRLKPLIEKAREVKSNYDELKKDLDKYEGGFKSQRGGIYEHDVYTELIEKSLDVVHDRTCPENYDYVNNKTILIIEDMDRIDPAHLFRILNVFGAHIDVESEKNKFGFTNILLVLDTDTTEHIFHHFYGEDANFEGYISKFLSHNSYHFDICEAAVNELTDFLLHKCCMSEDMIAYTEICHDSNLKLYDYIQTLSVRKIASILDDIESNISDEIIEYNGTRFRAVAPITYLLAVLVRMDIGITYDWMFQTLCKTPQVLYVLDSYLLINDIMKCGAPFTYKKNYFTVYAETDSENISTAKIQNATRPSTQNLNIDDMLEKSFELAMSKVSDCKM